MRALYTLTDLDTGLERSVTVLDTIVEQDGWDEHGPVENLIHRFADAGTGVEIKQFDMPKQYRVDPT